MSANSISAGTKLGQYEIVARLGAGGMGEVYRARDTRLGREVAVKALSGDFSSDPLRLSRFETEARSASALNHPNIVTIHEFGRSAATPFIVMELVDGRTLRDVLHGGALAVRKALNLAAQFADALAQAHEAGIVHRDLKPENVMVTRDGFIKVLDFGLAKIERRENGIGPHRLGLTVTEETRDGAVIGTAGYMSPEQASGQAVDFRSDQFSFAVIVYEMLAGQRAFQRPTRAETLAAIIREEPEPLATLCPRIPVPLYWIVERCMAKLPEERYASTRDLARDLQSVRDHFSQIDSGADGAALLMAANLRRSRRWLSIGVALAFAMLVASAYFLGTSARDASPPSFHRLTFRDGTIWAARFAPDGQTVVYGAAWSGGPIRIYSTRPEIPESSALALPPSSVLAISPSGEMAISLSARPSGPFSTAGTLARSTLAGGGAREILEGVQGSDFSPDGGSLLVLRSIEGRSRLEYPVGKTLYEAMSGYLSDARVSPRGDRVAFVEHPMRGDDSGSVAVVDLEGHKRTLSAGWTTVRGLAWGPDGNEVWFTAAAVGSSRALHAVSLSGQRRLVARVPGALTLQDVSREGRVLVAEEQAREGVMGILPGQQKEQDLSWHDWSRPIDLAADGARFLFDETGEGGGAAYSVYMRLADGSPAVRLGEGRALALSPDGNWALATPQTSPAELVLMPTGTGQARSIPTGRFANILKASFFPDGERVLVAANEPGRAARLYVQPLEGGAARPITSEGAGSDFAISPDGTEVAAAAAGGGSLALHPVDGGEPREIPGAAMGDIPIRFAPDGRYLYVLVRGEGPQSTIERLNLTTGQRQLWKKLAPPDPVGVYGVPRALLSADGQSYLYAYVRLLDALFLVDGLK
jgi:Tol biopolymer transport system component